MKKRESIDLAIILIWPIIAALISFTLKVNAFMSIVLFLIIPSVYISIRGRQYIKKAVIFSLISSISIMIIIDYIAHFTRTWIIPNSIIPFRLFNFVSLEVILWAFFTCFFVIMFYEYFLDKHVTKRLWNKKMKYLFMASIILFAVFLLLFFNLPEALKIPYFYISWGVIVLLIPFLFQLFKYPKTTSKFFLAAAYFFYLHFIYEVTGLRLGWWEFPGKEFIGWISILGTNFPLEELLFWFILLALATLSYYEYFDDDEK